ncbi:hypothetical protein NL676_036596 [Syzygium grande]|nr:hypothetical protein NL676_036596 [Syzygium grande]
MAGEERLGGHWGPRSLVGGWWRGPNELTHEGDGYAWACAGLGLERDRERTEEERRANRWPRPRDLLPTATRTNGVWLARLLGLV